MKKLIVVSVFVLCFMNAAGTLQSQEQILINPLFTSYAKKASVATGALITSPFFLNAGLVLSGLSSIYYGQKYMKYINSEEYITWQNDKKSLSELDDTIQKYSTIISGINKDHEQYVQLNQTSQELTEGINNLKNAFDSECAKTLSNYMLFRNKYAGSLIATAAFGGLWWWKIYCAH